jgi:hypothetical protein
MFVRPGIEHGLGAGAVAPHLGGVVHAKPAALVQSAGMGKDVAAAGFIDVEANHLLADRTLGGDRVKPPSAQELDAQELDELDDPYRDVPHVPSPKAQPRKTLHLNEIMTALLGRRRGRQAPGFALSSDTPDQLTQSIDPWRTCAHRG